MLKCAKLMFADLGSMGYIYVLMKTKKNNNQIKWNEWIPEIPNTEILPNQYTMELFHGTGKSMNES